MKPEHLAAYEPAARIHCQLTGVDPDSMVVMPHPTIVGIKERVPMWQITAERLFDLSLLLTALKRAGEKPKPEIMQ